MAVYLTNSFEQGTNGTTITAANSGGGNDSAFNVVSIGAGSTLTFSSTEAAHGALSGKLTEPASAVSTTFAWTTSLTGSSIPTVYFRAYVWYPALPAAAVRLISILNGSTFLGAVQLNATGKLSALNAAGVAQTFTGNGITATTNALNTGAWSRIEGFITGSATAGQISVSVYNSMDSATPTETETTAATVNTTSALTQIRFGDSGTANSFTVYLDDVGASDTALLGPAQLSGSAAAALVLTASAAGSRVQSGTVPAALTLAASAAGSSRRAGSPAAALSVAVAAAGARRQAKTASGVLQLAMTAAGVVVVAGTPASSSPSVAPAGQLTPTVTQANVSVPGTGQPVTSTPAVSGG